MRAMLNNAGGKKAVRSVRQPPAGYPLAPLAAAQGWSRHRGCALPGKRHAAPAGTGSKQVQLSWIEFPSGQPRAPQAPGGGSPAQASTQAAADLAGARIRITKQQQLMAGLQGGESGSMSTEPYMPRRCSEAARELAAPPIACPCPVWSFKFGRGPITPHQVQAEVQAACPAEQGGDLHT